MMFMFWPGDHFDCLVPPLLSWKTKAKRRQGEPLGNRASATVCVWLSAFGVRADIKI